MADLAPIVALRAQRTAEIAALRAEFAWLRLVLRPLPHDRRRRRHRVMPRVSLRALRQTRSLEARRM